MSILHKFIHRINIIPIEIPVIFFIETDKLEGKFTWKWKQKQKQKPRIAKSIIKKEQSKKTFWFEDLL